MQIYIKDGAVGNGSSLCETCSQGFVARGYGETELLVVCQLLYPERQMRFLVRACTGYVEKNKPAMRDMEKIALVLDPVALKRDIGFLREDQAGKSGEKIELVLDQDSR
jgi:hypothetical protein